MSRTRRCATRSATRASSSARPTRCIATLRPGRPKADLLFTLPKHADWDLGVLTRYIRHTHPPVQRDMLIGSVRRRGGAWGAMALLAPGRAFDREDRRLIARIAAVLSAAVHRIDRDRLLGVRDRIDRKIMEQIHPKDLFYQILDGIRSLTLYDHSSALLIREEDEASLRVVAEQIAWTKAKSERIGLRIPISDDAAALLQSERVYGFDRHGDTWHEWSDQPVGALAAMLDYNSADTAPPARTSGKGRCCARRWSHGTASSACSRLPPVMRNSSSRSTPSWWSTSGRRRRSPSRTCTAPNRSAPAW